MREIELSRGLVALVDDADFDTVAAVGKWYATPGKKTFYARKNFEVEPDRWESTLMHSLLTGWKQVDHINGNGLDNRRANLRSASAMQNSQNRGMRSDNRSGYKGVSWNKSAGKWSANINVDGKRIYLGVFSTAIEAAVVYDAAATDLFGPFARLNNPPAPMPSTSPLYARTTDSDDVVRPSRSDHDPKAVQGE